MKSQKNYLFKINNSNKLAIVTRFPGIFIALFQQYCLHADLNKLFGKERVLQEEINSIVKGLGKEKSKYSDEDIKNISAAVIVPNISSKCRSTDHTKWWIGCLIN